MSNTLAFGTYVPGTSVIHQTNAQVKIILACAFSIAAFFVDSWIGLGLLCCMTALAYAASRIPLGHFVSGLRPVAMILLFTWLAHVFTFDVNNAGLAQSGSLGFTQTFAIMGLFGLALDGVFTGLYFALRIALLVAVCSLLTFSTPMSMLVFGLGRLLGPLRTIKMPVDDICLVVSMALRFVPTVAEEAAGIKSAHMARGVDFESGPVMGRIRAVSGVFVPLFVRLFKKADTLGRAMDARCYGAGARVCLRESAASAVEVGSCVVILVLLIAVCILF